MKEKLKVMTVVGTRPEIIRLSRVMAALDHSAAIEHIIVHTKHFHKTVMLVLVTAIATAVVKLNLMGIL